MSGVELKNDGSEDSKPHGLTLTVVLPNVILDEDTSNTNNASNAIDVEKTEK